MTPDASLPPDACFCVMLHGVAHARGEGCPPADVQHTCFAGPILEDRCAVCNKEFRVDVQRPTPLTDDDMWYDSDITDRSWLIGERLTEIEEVARKTADSLVVALIADLRASRERIKELEAEVEEWKQAHRSEVGY